MENKKIDVVLSKRVSNLRLASSSKMELFDENGKKVNCYFNIAETGFKVSSFRTQFIEKAVFVITKDMPDPNNIPSIISPNNNAKYTFMILRECDCVFDPNNFANEDIFDVVLCKFDRSYITLVSEDDINALTSAINRVADNNDMFFIHSVINHKSIKVTDEEYEKDGGNDIFKRTYNGDIYRVLSSSVSLPTLGGLEVSKAFVNESTTPIFKKSYNDLFEKPYTLDSKDINTEEMVEKIGNLCETAIETLRIKPYNHPDYINLHDNNGKPLRWLYVDSNVTGDVDKNVMSKDDTKFSEYKYSITDDSHLTAELESIRRGSNIVSYVRRDILEDMFTQVIDAISGFSHSAYTHSTGNRLVTSILNPTLNMNPSVNIEAFKYVVKEHGDKIFRYENEDGSDYMNYDSVDSCQGIFFGVPAFINIETKPILDLEPKIKEVMEVLKGKIHRHIDPKMNFGSCKIDNITNYVKDRDARIQFMMQLIINFYAMLDLIKDINGREVISLLELNAMVIKHSHFGWHNIMYTDGYPEAFHTYMLSSSYSNLAVSIDGIITNIMMFKGLDMLGSEITLNDKFTMILKTVVGKTDYADPFNKDLKVAINEVENIVNRAHGVEYNLDTNSTARTANAIDVILRQR